MKNHFAITYLIVLTIFILSCRNSGSNNGQTSSPIAVAAPECFMKRLTDFKSSYPNFRGGYEPLHYAGCKNSQNDFMQRLNEFKSAHRDLSGSYQPLYYAASQHNTNDFMQRLNEFKSAHRDLSGSYEPLYYAASGNKLCN